MKQRGSEVYANHENRFEVTISDKGVKIFWRFNLFSSLWRDEIVANIKK